MSFDFFARGLHTRTAVARLPLRQLRFLVGLRLGLNAQSVYYLFCDGFNHGLNMRFSSTVFYAYGFSAEDSRLLMFYTPSNEIRDCMQALVG